MKNSNDINSMLSSEIKKIKRYKPPTKDNLVSLTSPVSDELAFAQIKNRKVKQYKCKDNIEDWNNKDFANFIFGHFRTVIGQDWKVNPIGVVTYMNRIKEMLFKITGDCSNKTLRDYINYYFKYHFKIDYTKKNEFYLQNLRNDQTISQFGQIKDSHSSELKQYTDITLEQLNKNYLLGNDILLIKYGFILTINYLLAIKKLEIERVLNTVFYQQKDILRDSTMLKLIIDKTNELSPCSENLDFKNIDYLNKKIGYVVGNDNHLSINVVFSEVELGNFLTRKNK
ncbi:MAG: hypothetical protein WDA06_00095 [Phenylobacterium sp.]